jgi:transposase InsO family protein
MRYPASEKLEIIRTVETSHLPVRRTLDKIGIPKTTFYAWLDRYAAGGLDALEDRKPRPRRIWNRIPDEIRDKVIERALEKPELSPREVAVAFTDAEKTFVSEASVYRILKAEGLVTSPAFIVMKAADAFANPTTAINQLWQTDFTYLKVTGWGWFYLSTVLDDFSRYIVAWKLCTTMSAADVTATLELALQASGLDHAEVESAAASALRQRAILRRQRSVRLARGTGHAAYTRQAVPPDDPGQNRAMASLAEESHPA